MPSKKSKAANRRSSPDKAFVQFSKKLIAGVMIFWGVIRLWSVIALWLNPESGTAMAAIVRGVDDIAMINVLAYTGNSVSEKIALGYFQMKTDIASKEDDDEEVNVG